MDIDLGIYPYVDSFPTTTGQVCSGLGIPEEAIETTIGVVSAVQIIGREFLNRIQTFPTEIEKPNSQDNESHKLYEQLKTYLHEHYNFQEKKYAFGWLDINLITHSDIINQLSSIYLTGLDALNDLDKIKICTQYSKDGEALKQGTLPALID